MNMGIFQAELMLENLKCSFIKRGFPISERQVDVKGGCLLSADCYQKEVGY